MPESVEVSVARIEAQIAGLRSDLARYFDELSNQDDRIRAMEKCVVRLSERLTIASAALAGLQLIIAAVVAWIASR